MQSATTDPAARAAGPRARPSPTDAQVRIVYNAVRTLVPESATLRLGDLLAVTRLDPEPAAAAMRRLAREGSISIHRIAGDDEPTWLVRRETRAKRESRNGRAAKPRAREAPEGSGGVPVSEANGGSSGRCSDGEAASRTDR